MILLAPIEGITDAKFRTICHRNGCDETFTEMARLDSLVRKNKSTLNRIRIEDGTPTHIQIIGNKETKLARFLDHYHPEPGFLGINLNVGCPSPDMIRVGLGCAMMKRISRINAMGRAVRDAGYVFSVKLRLGLNAFEKQKKVYLNLIEGVEADLFIVHARHGKESYDDPADFTVYDECVKTGRNIIANGDISTAEQVTDLYRRGLKGVMIGRAAIKNPDIFKEIKKIQ